MANVMVPEPAEVMGVLVREHGIRVLNCSPSGCLLETRAPVEVGTVGSLGLSIDGHDLLDHLVVVRCQRIEGAGSIYHIGARFLLIGSMTDPSLRLAVGRPAAPAHAV